MFFSLLICVALCGCQKKPVSTVQKESNPVEQQELHEGLNESAFKSERHGFTIHLPKDWDVITNESSSVVVQAIEPSGTNLDVVVLAATKGQPAISLDFLAKEMIKSIEASSPLAVHLETTDIQLGKMPAKRIDLNNVSQGMPIYQVSILAMQDGKTTAVITLSAKRDQFETWKEILLASAKTFRF